MFRIYKFSFLIVLVGFLCSCASSLMTTVPSGDALPNFGPDKALVNFIRASGLGGAVQSVLYDGEKYIGTISAGTRVSYQAEAGSHLFMVTGDSADFMMAELLPGKEYYCVISAYPGFTYRFAFRPINGQVPQNKIDAWLDKAREVEINEKGEMWAENNEGRASKFKEKYFPKWKENNDQNKKSLLPESGI